MKKIISLFLLLSLSLSYLTLLQAQVPSTKEVELLASWSGQAQSVQVQGQYAYVGLTGTLKNLQVLDVSRPKAPVLVGELDLKLLSDPIMDIQIVGNIAYIAAGWDDVHLVDISQPQAPRELGWIDLSGRSTRLVISGTRAYVASVSQGLYIIDVSNPAAPIEVGKYKGGGELTDLRLMGSQIYLAYGSRGVQVIDVSDPTQPIIKQNYNSLLMQQLFNTNTTLYMANELQNGLYIAPLSNLTKTTFYPLPGQVQAMRLVNNLLYVAADSGGLRVLDVTTPLSPTEVGYYDTDGTAINLAVTRSDVYVADGANGLLALRYIGVGAEPTLTPTPTDTPIPSDTPTPTPTIAITPTPGMDIYEADNSCAEAKTITTDGIIQQHTIHVAGDQDWVQFQVTKGITYFIEVRTLANSRADMTLSLYDKCDHQIHAVDNTFSADVVYTLNAPADGTFFLYLTDSQNFGTDVGYTLSVRSSNQANSKTGALILVAGRKKIPDGLQVNIYNVIDRVYRVFLRHDYKRDRIYYLAPTLNEPNRPTMADALATKDNLHNAITSWAKDKVGPDRSLTLYMMDHGSHGLFYLDQQESLSPAELDSWLTELENATGVKVNVILEACFSGSFIERYNGSSLSKPGRVIISATGSELFSWASPSGAVFSDAFIAGLDANMSLQAAFEEARQATWQAYRDVQTPWLDDNGDGLFDNRDGRQAMQRGFVFTGTLDDRYAPYIKIASVDNLKGSMADVKAKVLDDGNVKDVWAIIYPPSYKATLIEGEMVVSPLPVPLIKDIGGGWRASTYSEFNERGEYRLVFYANDNDGWQSRPYEIRFVPISVTNIYLPLIQK